MTCSRPVVARAIAVAAACLAAMASPCSAQPKLSSDCGQAVTIQTHDRTTTRYAFAHPTAPGQGEPIVVVLHSGGGGHVDLDAGGCPRALKGNSLVRSIPHFHDLGFATALAGPSAPDGVVLTSA